MARIMISDDSEAIRMVLKDILEIGQHQLVGEAKDGADAVNKFRELKPDLLLLDFAMPKKDGLTALKEIMVMTPKAKVIMITASDNLNMMNECLELGSTAFILKPFDFDEVLRIISNALA